MHEFTYVGDELDLFAAATHWKSYLRTQIVPYLGRNVLEVGAGFGGTTKYLCQGDHDGWVCLEPDIALANRLADAIRAGDLPAFCRVEVGTLADRPAVATFDTLLYIDVLEHVDDDAAELARAIGQVRPGGYIVVLSPAHQWLFSEFDRAIGHYRRYTRQALAGLTPPGLEPVRMAYLDSVGLLASLANRLLLRSALPTPKQIAVWDRFMVPLSRSLDGLLAHKVGKSVLAVWRRTSHERR